MSIIFDNLLPGKESCVSAEELCERLGIKDTRTLRHLITAERERGIPIAGCENGYYRPVRLGEYVETWRWFDKRAKSSFKIAKLFRDKIKNEFEGQQSLFDPAEDEAVERFFMSEVTSEP